MEAPLYSQVCMYMYLIHFYNNNYYLITFSVCDCFILLEERRSRPAVSLNCLVISILVLMVVMCIHWMLDYLN